MYKIKFITENQNYEISSKDPMKCKDTLFQFKKEIKKETNNFYGKDEVIYNYIYEYAVDFYIELIETESEIEIDLCFETFNAFLGILKCYLRDYVYAISTEDYEIYSKKNVDIVVFWKKKDIYRAFKDLKNDYF